MERTLGVKTNPKKLRAKSLGGFSHIAYWLLAEELVPKSSRGFKKGEKLIQVYPAGNQFPSFLLSERAVSSSKGTTTLTKPGASSTQAVIGRRGEGR